jgi:hypothetical protein
MKRITRTLLVVVLAAAMLAIAAPPSGAAGNGKVIERPHVTRSTGTNTNGECDLSGFPIVTCPFEGTTSGVGTHVGRFTGPNAGTVTLDFTQVCVGVNGESGTPIALVASAVLVAANGSEIHSHSEATGCFVDFGVGTEYVGSVTIDGGTGRFEGASGLLSSTTMLVGPDVVVTNRGTITY